MESVLFSIEDDLLIEVKNERKPSIVAITRIGATRNEYKSSILCGSYTRHIGSLLNAKLLPHL